MVVDRGAAEPVDVREVQVVHEGLDPAVERGCAVETLDDRGRREGSTVGAFSAAFGQPVKYGERGCIVRLGDEPEWVTKRLDATREYESG